MLVIVLMQAEERKYISYCLSRLERRSLVTSCIPSLAESIAVRVSLCALVLQIQRSAERTHASNALALVVKDKCLDVHCKDWQHFLELSPGSTTFG
jgi:hypothetical protein